MDIRITTFLRDDELETLESKGGPAEARAYLDLVKSGVYIDHEGKAFRYEEHYIEPGPILNIRMVEA